MIFQKPPYGGSATAHRMMALGHRGGLVSLWQFEVPGVKNGGFAQKNVGLAWKNGEFGLEQCWFHHETCGFPHQKRWICKQKVAIPRIARLKRTIIFQTIFVWILWLCSRNSSYVGMGEQLLVHQKREWRVCTSNVLVNICDGSSSRAVLKFDPCTCAFGIILIGLIIPSP